MEQLPTYKVSRVYPVHLQLIIVRLDFLRHQLAALFQKLLKILMPHLRHLEGDTVDGKIFFQLIQLGDGTAGDLLGLTLLDCLAEVLIRSFFADRFVDLCI